jgi:alanyl-tRNA synthetase
MEAKEIRQKYLEFFKSKGHKAIPSSPLLPENDPTVLFTTAGMHPLVPYLLGEPHPAGKRLTSFQKCIRTGDIDEVGDNTHLTFFEMLGNWSLGDYFKKEAIEWSFELLTSKKWLGIPVEKLAVSVFKGDDDAPQDKEAAETWKKLGIPEHKIAYLPKKNNWWGPAGITGPCGPDTEMFYWVGKGLPPKNSDPGNDEKNWVEIWNDVFMQYNKNETGKFEPLKQKNVDTGLGLERVTAVLQGKESVYDTELFSPIIEKISGLTKIGYSENKASYRIIADHLRAATMMAGDGVKPSNVDQGYVMRRLIRRAIRHGKILGIEENFTHTIAKKVIHMMSNIYPELNHEEEILKTFEAEEAQFRKTVNHGISEFIKLTNNLKIDIISPVLIEITNKWNLICNDFDEMLIEEEKIYQKLINNFKNLNIKNTYLAIKKDYDNINLKKNKWSNIKLKLTKLLNINTELDNKLEIFEMLNSLIDNLYLPYKSYLQNLKTFATKSKSVLKTQDEVNKLLSNSAIKTFEKISKELANGIISGIDAFHLYDTFGFPIEMTEELAKEKGLTVDRAGFEAAFKEHQAKSRMGAEVKFKGGLQDNSEETTKLHTATHLLHAALHKYLGDHANQKGSNITAERLRFDFTHPDKMTAEQLAEVEKFVNDAIKSDAPVICETMTLDEAKKSGAIGLFENKYGDKVKVYTIKGWSKEICGGPHVEHTGVLGKFKIVKEESSSAGVRRIKAILTKE